MKKAIFILFTLIGTGFVFAQHHETAPVLEVQVPCDSAKYAMVPTMNLYTYLKLDTSTGQIKQVHFTLSEQGYEGELILNDFPLVADHEKKNGRFHLYPTQNMYNFLLLDRIDGRVWQVQWNYDSKNRGIRRLK